MVVIDVEPIQERFSTVAPFLDERGRRLVAAAEAFAAGYGGIAAVAMATGMAPSTIGRGLKELARDEPSERVRRPGAGRKLAIVKDPPPGQPLASGTCGSCRLRRGEAVNPAAFLFRRGEGQPTARAVAIQALI